jgi:hypothetical protein
MYKGDICATISDWMQWGRKTRSAKLCPKADQSCGPTVGLAAR